MHKLAEFLTSDSLTAQGFFEFEGFTGHLPAKRARDFQGWVQISAGCNMKCAFCIVPSTRGREVSRPLEELVAEIEALAADGVREVTCSARTSTRTGSACARSRAGSRSRWRPSTPSTASTASATPAASAYMREDVIRAHVELPSVCEHIHLPLQAGSSRILKAMRRTYDRGRYMDRVALIREHVPDCAITTDIIVGFPGETEADFRETLEVAEEVGYDGAFMFIYSPRRGTEAATFSDDFIPHEVAVERMERLVEVIQRRARERAQRFVGRTLDVLVEGTLRTDASRVRGRTRHNKVVNFDGLASPGEFVPVRHNRRQQRDARRRAPLLARAADFPPSRPISFRRPRVRHMSCAGTRRP